MTITTIRLLKKDTEKMIIGSGPSNDESFLAEKLQINGSVSNNIANNGTFKVKGNDHSISFNGDNTTSGNFKFLDDCHFLNDFQSNSSISTPKNIVNYSEYFNLTDTDWLTNGPTSAITIDDNNINDPINNTLTATLLTNIGIYSYIGIRNTVNVSNNTYFFSIYLKRKDTTSTLIGLWDHISFAWAGYVDIFWDVNNVPSTNTSVNVSNITYESIGDNDWYRCSFKIVIGNDPIGRMIQIHPDRTATGKSLWIWGVQLEQSETLSPYEQKNGSTIINTTNLIIGNNLTSNNELTVNGNTNLKETNIINDLAVNGNITVSNNIEVTEDLLLSGSLNIQNSLKVGNDLILKGDILPSNSPTNSNLGSVEKKWKSGFFSGAISCSDPIQNNDAVTKNYLTNSFSALKESNYSDEYGEFHTLSISEQLITTLNVTLTETGRYFYMVSFITQTSKTAYKLHARVLAFDDVYSHTFSDNKTYNVTGIRRSGKQLVIHGFATATSLNTTLKVYALGSSNIDIYGFRAALLKIN
jgi:hypothetical protein